MEQFNFDSTYTLGECVLETAQYRHIHCPEMLVRYDSNFIQFKELPSLGEFQEVERYLRAFHEQRGQKHLKFYFPADQKVDSELASYLRQQGYHNEVLELYVLDPKTFPKVSPNPQIEIQVVTADTLDDLLKLKYQQDLDFGEAFAQQKQGLTRRNLEASHIQQILAFYQGAAVGYLDVILAEETVEIDDFVVDASHQKQGVGSHLQQFVMATYPERTVLLLADGEDTPREMYRKQNYQCQGFKCAVLKVL